MNIILEIFLNNLVLFQTSKSILKQMELTIMSLMCLMSLSELTWSRPQCLLDLVLTTMLQFGTQLYMSKSTLGERAHRIFEAFLSLVHFKIQSREIFKHECKYYEEQRIIVEHEYDTF